MGLFEMNAAAEIIHGVAHADANIIFGTVIDDEMGDEVKVTVIAAGFDRLDGDSARPAKSPTSISELFAEDEADPARHRRRRRLRRAVVPALTGTGEPSGDVVGQPRRRPGAHRCRGWRRVGRGARRHQGVRPGRGHRRRRRRLPGDRGELRPGAGRRRRTRPRRQASRCTSSDGCSRTRCACSPASSTCGRRSTGRSLVREVARRAPGATVLVQVNATGEPGKGGCPIGRRAVARRRRRAPPDSPSTG